ncbi:MAG TPA: type II toxin-antitoxin system Phd/YefM family antitoxin [Herbaspirillum sp.]|uniref:type II toxin-antitoxin system Phd/YefM family antitoxin n=1 Tax=Herbaspirillum sp. TaxID=1890675 RepID=UPI002D7069E3|nr:type II toxin-antitoxin system Phd/YefM family antitoxin [Herbaspirillum sp.]HZG18845.1 type II toxin-antitoxin system Phd/YefM family antitoxin [Herbaspirillum sp.]
MMITTFSDREFNRNVTKAKKASLNGPVFITDRGQPTHVLLSLAEYQRLTSKHQNIADALAMPGVGDIDFDAPRSNIGLKPPDFS